LNHPDERNAPRRTSLKGRGYKIRIPHQRKGGKVVLCEGRKAEERLGGGEGGTGKRSMKPLRRSRSGKRFLHKRRAYVPKRRRRKKIAWKAAGKA